MPTTPNLETEAGQPIVYEIRIKGHLGSQWTDWFGGLTVTLEDNGETLLAGPVVDQAALHGVLKKMRDLGMPLVSVNRVLGDLAPAISRYVPDLATEASRKSMRPCWQSS